VVAVIIGTLVYWLYRQFGGGKKKSHERNTLNIKRRGKK
jgi:hypothetical protein